MFCRAQLQKWRIFKIHFELTLFFLLFTPVCAPEKSRALDKNKPKKNLPFFCGVGVTAKAPQGLNGGAVGGVNGCGYGSCLVERHFARALAEEPPVGRSVLALHAARELVR